MLNNGLDAASAAFEVGYESPTQFSREYSRFFGQPPIEDIRAFAQVRNKGLRANGCSPVAAADFGGRLRPTTDLSF